MTCLYKGRQNLRVKETKKSEEPKVIMVKKSK